MVDSPRLGYRPTSHRAISYPTSTSPDYYSLVVASRSGGGTSSRMFAGFARSRARHYFGSIATHTAKEQGEASVMKVRTKWLEPAITSMLWEVNGWHRAGEATVTSKELLERSFVLRLKTRTG